MRGKSGPREGIACKFAFNLPLVRRGLMSSRYNTIGEGEAGGRPMPAAPIGSSRSPLSSAAQLHQLTAMGRQLKLQPLRLAQAAAVPQVTDLCGTGKPQLRPGSLNHGGRISEVEQGCKGGPSWSLGCPDGGVPMPVQGLGGPAFPVGAPPAPLRW